MAYNGAMESSDGLVLGLVVAARFLVPLLIPRFPVPALLAAMTLDAVDRDIFGLFAVVPVDSYQGYDKALDAFYLTIAGLAALRNWGSFTAVRIARFLLYYRLVGVALFELTAWRPFLLVFPNTFEYFFLAYELMATRWFPHRLARRHLLLLVSGLWVLIKLPQEYWIHVARLDVTDELSAADPTFVWSAGGLAIAVLILAGVAARRLLPPPDHRLTLAAPALPPGMDSAARRARFVAQRWRIVDERLVEKVWLTSLITILFAQIVPGVEVSPSQLGVGVAVVVAYNSFLRLRVARAGRSIDSAATTFALLLLSNAVWVYAASSWLHGDSRFATTHSFFFLSLLSLIVTMYDRWRPVCELRHDAQHQQWNRAAHQAVRGKVTVWGVGSRRKSHP